VALETFGDDACTSRRAGDETEVSELNGTKRWYAQRKQRRTDVLFCERAPPKRGVGEEIVANHATRWTRFFQYATRADPTKNRGKQFFFYSNTCTQVDIDGNEGMNPSKDEEEGRCVVRNVPRAG
jgi:sulfur relay (sulfurtransferase) complex TusBCD TusD component (DsrE family)